jgi:hypothetical protein
VPGVRIDSSIACSSGRGYSRRSRSFRSSTVVAAWTRRLSGARAGWALRPGSCCSSGLRVRGEGPASGGRPGTGRQGAALSVAAGHHAPRWMGHCGRLGLHAPDRRWICHRRTATPLPAKRSSWTPGTCYRTASGPLCRRLRWPALSNWRRDPGRCRAWLHPRPGLGGITSSHGCGPRPKNATLT